MRCPCHARKCAPPTETTGSACKKNRAGTAPLSAVEMDVSFVSVVCLCIPLVVRGSFVAVHLNTSPVTYNGESLADLWGRGSVDALRCWPAAVRRLVQLVKKRRSPLFIMLRMKKISSIGY